MNSKHRNIEFVIFQQDLYAKQVATPFRPRILVHTVLSLCPAHQNRSLETDRKICQNFYTNVKIYPKYFRSYLCAWLIRADHQKRKDVFVKNTSSFPTDMKNYPKHFSSSETTTRNWNSDAEVIRYNFRSLCILCEYMENTFCILFSSRPQEHGFIFIFVRINIRLI